MVALRDLDPNHRERHIRPCSSGHMALGRDPCAVYKSPSSDPIISLRQEVIHQKGRLGDPSQLLANGSDGFLARLEHVLLATWL